MFNVSIEISLEKGIKLESVGVKFFTSKIRQNISFSIEDSILTLDINISPVRVLNRISKKQQTLKANDD